MSDPPLMQNHTLKVADIYVPAARRKTLEPDKVEKIAESMIEEGQITPIQVRKDGERYVLIEGLHRLEACRALGEETIVALLVQPRRH
ncbi:MAG: ParB N-terminal domain-containing protein [Rickettsiales bacterium]|jgi:sulfiredoxin